MVQRLLGLGRGGECHMDVSLTQRRPTAREALGRLPRPSFSGVTSRHSNSAVPFSLPSALPPPLTTRRRPDLEWAGRCELELSRIRGDWFRNSRVVDPSFSPLPQWYPLNRARSSIKVNGQYLVSLLLLAVAESLWQDPSSALLICRADGPPRRKTNLRVLARTVCA